MNRFLTQKSYYGSSSICKELNDKTASLQLSWVSYEDFLDFLELEGIAFDDISWFFKYLKYLRAIRHIPVSAGTYFAIFGRRLFALSQSKYSRDVRLDFISILSSDNNWHMIFESQQALKNLHSIVEIIENKNANELCKDLLYATGCIHA